MKRAVAELAGHDRGGVAAWFERAAAVAGQTGRFRPRRQDEF
jgi:hypothetical protein